MKMRRIHAIQIARELQRVENQKKRDTDKKQSKRRGIISRLMGYRDE
jgi:hypothetical protein